MLWTPENKSTLAAPAKALAKPWPNLKWGWQDVAPTPFQASRAAERDYRQKLKSVAGRVAAILSGRGDPAQKQALLRRYAETLKPWAESAASSMIGAVDRSNVNSWRNGAVKISAALEQQMSAAVDGVSIRKMIEVAASQIRSIPQKAADRVPDVIAKAVISGERAEITAKKIEAFGQIGEIAHSDAIRIARTSISTVQTQITRQRAKAIGSPGYIWRSAGDDDVREDHAAMDGRFVEWDDPPVFGGRACHAGEDYGCRCYAEPVVPKPGGGFFDPILPVSDFAGE